MGRPTDKQVTEAEKKLSAAEANLTRLRAEQEKTERSIAFYTDIQNKSKLTLQGVGPCDKCGRHVPSPCDNAQGYHESGPWDGFCREYFS